MTEKLGSKNTELHQYVLLRSASIHRLLNNNDGVENVFQKCVQIAYDSERELTPQDGGAKMSERVFYWESMLLRHYLEMDLDEAIDYGRELEEKRLPLHCLHDVKFALGTAYSLRMEGYNDLDDAISSFNTILGDGEEAPKAPVNSQHMNDFRGIVANNIGMSYASKFILMAQDDSLGQDKIKLAVENINEAVKYLKRSVRLIEGFEQRIPKSDGKDEEVEVSVADLEMRHFAKGFFDAD